MNDNAQLPSHIKTTYLHLRRGMAIIAFLFPFVLWLGAELWNGTTLQSSISAYYHTDLRNIFVGVLCAIGVFLYLYKGIGRENIALNIAGVCALGIAFFPTDPSLVCEMRDSETLVSKMHGVFAVVFFLAISYVCIFLSEKTLPGYLSDQQKKKFNRVYKICGAAMLTCIALGIVSMFIPAEFEARICRIRPVFIIEATAIFAFSIYWITKSNEIDRAVSWLPWRKKKIQ